MPKIIVALLSHPQLREQMLHGIAKGVAQGGTTVSRLRRRTLPPPQPQKEAPAVATKRRSAPARAHSEGPEIGSETPHPHAATAKSPHWAIPSLSLLEKALSLPVDHSMNKQRAQLIERTLSEYGLEVTVEQIKPGPTVTLFGVAPGWVRKGRRADSKAQRNGDEEMTRVTVASILARERDLALALAVPSLRIQAPVPGEPVLGIEIPNRMPELVTLRSVLESAAYREMQKRMELPIALGKASGGEVVAVDLASMPHLLIAGATGSGKSVCMNSVICSILMSSSPLKVRLLLVDPKRVELTMYNGVPHLAGEVRVETEDIVRTLRGAIGEMERRYRQLEQARVRDIRSYNKKMPATDAMPYIVLAVDELADLMMVAPFDVEHSICRLAQLGRATGIHLVVATQRPSVDVVTGLIKANFPTRIAFQVASQVDSRTIMDTMGAEKLLGRGDMLFASPELPRPKRIQGAYISETETLRLEEFWRNQPCPPPPEIVLDVQPKEDAAGATEENEESDELFEKAEQMAVQLSRISTSLLQRRLRIGYPRAARLREELQESGVIDAEGRYVG